MSRIIDHKYPCADGRMARPTDEQNSNFKVPQQARLQPRPKGIVDIEDDRI